MSEPSLAVSERSDGGADVARRIARIEAWLSRQITLEFEPCALPRSGRTYRIAKPDQASRDRLFEEARQDSEKQMPHWAKIWASGVALADVVCERAEEVAGQQVLELGAGLGTTATAVLESGGSLVTADYSLLSLTLCRYNTLRNAARAPECLRFNWRSEPPPLRPARREAGFSLILAADVLYEGRDIFPLLDLVQGLFTPGAQLWLAEPVRKTAQRFLDTAAAYGWQGTSRTVHGPWPDGTSDPVNIHFLSWTQRLDRLPADLAGLRT